MFEAAGREVRCFFAIFAATKVPQHEIGDKEENLGVT